MGYQSWDEVLYIPRFTIGVRACFHGFPGGPAPGGVQFMALEVQLLSMEGWLVELEVMLAKPEWLKHLTRSARGL